ncbi:MAG: GntR family transcriptional regulator [Kiritimatiellae bacterium]|nr:GntR family transcriptional regulator [Kiritimatiellia bacterium]
MSPISQRRLLPEKVGEILLAYIRQQSLWGQRLPSQRSLAEQLGVSLVTVHKGMHHLREAGVLVSLPRQGTYVTRRVIDTLDAKPRPKMLFVCHSLQDPREFSIYNEMVAPLQEFASRQKLDSVFTRFDDSKSDISFATDYPPVKGSFLVFVRIDSGVDRIKRTLEAYRCPAVLLDHHFEELGIPGIVDDGFGAMREVTRHVLELGHRRIAYLDMASPHLNPWKRNGFKAALEERGVPLDPERMISVSSSPAKVNAVVTALMREPDRPTALVAVDDGRARTAIQALEAMGLRAGRDVSVTGYGDTASITGGSDSITSVKIDWREHGRVAVAYLEGKYPEQNGKMMTVGGELVVRGSTGPAPGAVTGDR